MASMTTMMSSTMTSAHALASRKVLPAQASRFAPLRPRNVSARAEGGKIREEVQGAPGVSVPDNKQVDSYERIESPVRGSVPDGGPPVAERREGRDDMFIQIDGAAEKKALGTEVAFPDIMRFNGAGPEVINSRLAMVGAISAIIAEVATGRTVFQQFQQPGAPAFIIGVGVLFTIASLIPMVKGVPRRGNKVFTSDAEIINGRLAMLGFAGIILNEVITKTPAL